MRIAHPGKFGDLLWALPTARAIAERDGENINLVIPGSLAPLTWLLGMQTDYISSVEIDPSWEVLDTAPATPISPPKDPTMPSLGYPQWPIHTLPFEVAYNAAVGGADNPRYWRPWINVASFTRGLADEKCLIVHWTDRWFELKLGILRELARAFPRVAIEWYAAPGTRMAEAGANECDWVALARTMTGKQVVLTDCSSAHVLAMAVGVPNVIVVEPETDRHHFIFWPGSDPHWQPTDTPLGRTIRPVLGNDRRPTFDSRHTIDAINEVFNAPR